MAQKQRPLESTTRTFDTTRGTVTYAELSDLIAPNLRDLLDGIDAGNFSSRPFDEDLIKEFHYRIISNVMPDIAGKWRKVGVQVGNHFPPEPYQVPILMREYADNVQARLANAESHSVQIETLAYAEGEFLHIHPFQDFNGRTIRALIRELLFRLDLPPVDTAVERDTDDYKLYQTALAEYDNGRLAALVDYWYRRFEKL